jgi:hypothetical protein
MLHPKGWANGGVLVMRAKERERLKIFLRVKRGELLQKEAAALCRLDYRYLRRLLSALLQARRSGLSKSRPWATIESS